MENIYREYIIMLIYERFAQYLFNLKTFLFESFGFTHSFFLYFACKYVMQLWSYLTMG